MSSKSCKLFVAFLLIIFLSTLFLSFLPNANSQNTSEELSKSQVENLVPQNILSMDIWVFLSGQYEPWNLNVHNEVMVNLTLGLANPPPTPYFIAVAITFSLTEVERPPGSNFTYGFWGFPPIGIVTVYMPANTSSLIFKGTLIGSSVFWRNTIITPIFNATSSLTGNLRYKLVLVPPEKAKVLKVFSRYTTLLQPEEIKEEGQRRIIVGGAYRGMPFVVLYESSTWESYAFVLMFAVISMFFAVPFIRKSKRASVVVPRIIDAFRSSANRALARFMLIFKSLYNKILSLDSSKFLSLYMLCAILMISFSSVAGPDPRIKVYILASTPENAEKLVNLVSSPQIGAVGVTVYDEMTEFETMTDLGVFSAVIVGNFFPPTADIAKEFIYPALDNVPKIIVVKRYATNEFTTEIEKRYEDKTVFLDDLSGLKPILDQIPKRTNMLGLEASRAGTGIFKAVSMFVGLLSFVLIFLGMSFLSCRLIEIGKKPWLGGFVETIVYSVLVFVFTQVVYIVSTVLLAVPVGLHTSIPKVTAIGFMGFGGGSRPRLIAGFAGLIFGAFLSMREGLKFDKIGFLSFLLLSFIVIIDPLTGGLIFYEFVLVFTSSTFMEHALATWSYMRFFFDDVARFFGAWISPSFGISMGTMLYFAGVVPLCLFPKLKRSTATFTLLACSFLAARGIVRVADMLPWKTFASIVPGLMVGFAFAAIFCAISLIEGMIRSKIVKRANSV